MIIGTENSVYRLSNEDGEVLLTKIEDKYPGGHPNVKVGDKIRGTKPRPPAVGQSFYVKRDWGTTQVLSIEPEQNDNLLQFNTAA